MDLQIDTYLWIGQLFRKKFRLAQKLESVSFWRPFKILFTSIETGCLFHNYRHQSQPSILKTLAIEVIQ
jgi:hypothetical protein